MKQTITKADRIAKRLAVGPERYIVLIDVAGRKDLPLEETNENVYCIDDENKVLWQIHASSPKMQRDSFVAISYSGESLRATRFFGSEYDVNLDSGQAIETGWRK